LPDEVLQIDWEALLAERIAEEEAMLSDSPYQFALLRAAALRQFASEERYADCFVVSLKAIGQIEEPSRPLPHARDEAIADALVVEAKTIPIVEVSVATPEPIEPELRDSEAIVEPSARIAEEEPSIVPFVAAVQTQSVESDEGVGEEAEALREFTLWGVLWVVGVDSPISDLARSELWEYFGSEAAAAIDEAENRDGDERCARRCANAAPTAARAPFELRRGTIEDVIHLALSAGPITARERDRLEDLAELLDLSPEDVEQAAAEVIDPEFAEYAFQEGQDVEARFDEEWTPGVVHTVDSGGGVRVYFPSLTQTLWLHPTSDLLRPVEASADRA
jgi:hypothetical protein